MQNNTTVNRETLETLFREEIRGFPVKRTEASHELP